MVGVFSFFYIALPGFMPALPQQVGVQEQRSDPSKGDAERLKKPTKYSDVPAKGEFENNSNELSSDPQRRTARLRSPDQ